MGKFKLVYSYFNESNGKSIVHVLYKGKMYEGKAQFNPEDTDIPISSFEGCQIAELRACGKALKAELAEKKEIYKEVLLFLANAGIPYSEVAHQLKMHEKDIQYRQKVIDNLYKTIDKQINNYYSFQENRKKKET